MSKSPKQKFQHTRKGLAVHLLYKERKMLELLFDHFRQLLFSGADPDLARLEPPACLDDPLTELEYRAMAANQLLKHRLEAIEFAENGLKARNLDSEMVSAWLQTLNGLRLYLSERLELHDSKNQPSPELNTHDNDDNVQHDNVQQGKNATRLSRSEDSKNETLERSEQIGGGSKPSVFNQPKRELLVIYQWLSELLEQLVTAASEDLPPDPEDA